MPGGKQLPPGKQRSGLTWRWDLLSVTSTWDGGVFMAGQWLLLRRSRVLAYLGLSAVVPLSWLADVDFSCTLYVLLVPCSSLSQLLLCMFQDSMFSHQEASFALFLQRWSVEGVWFACCNRAVAIAWCLSACECLPRWTSWAATVSLLPAAVFYNSDSWGVGRGWFQFQQWVCYASLRVFGTLMFRTPCIFWTTSWQAFKLRSLLFHWTEGRPAMMFCARASRYWQKRRTR